MPSFNTPYFGDGLATNPGLPSSFVVRNIGPLDCPIVPVPPTRIGKSGSIQHEHSLLNVSQYAAFGTRKITSLVLLSTADTPAAPVEKNTRKAMAKIPPQSELPTVCVEVRVEMKSNRLPFDVPQVHGEKYSMLAMLSEDKPNCAGLGFAVPFGAKLAVVRAWVLEEGPPASSSSTEKSWSVEMQVSFEPVQNPPPNLRPILKYCWYQVKGTTTQTMIGHRTGTVHQAVAVDVTENPSKPGQDVPPTMLFLRSGSSNTGRVGGSCSSTMDKMEAKGQQQDNFHQYIRFNHRFSPARSDKVVRIRRHPNRFSDVVATVPFGTTRTAIGVCVDKVHGDRYLILDDEIPEITDDVIVQAPTLPGGYSRFEGSEGRFWLPAYNLVETRKSLGPSAYYTPTRKGRSLRIREHPSLGSQEIGLVEPNEVKRAVAIHYSLPCGPNGGVGLIPDGNIVSSSSVGAVGSIGSNKPLFLSCDGSFVEWASGGFSIMASNDPEELMKKGSYLVELPSIDKPLVCPTRYSTTSRRAQPESPAIVDLDKLTRDRKAVQRMKRNRGDDDFDLDNIGDDISEMSMPGAQDDCIDDPAMEDLHRRGRNLRADDLPRLDLL